MRRMLIAALAALGAGAVTLMEPGPRGEAQSTGSPFLGASPRAIQFKPIDTKSAIGNLNTQKIMSHKSKLPSAPNLGSFFPKIPQLSWPPKLAATPAIDPHKNPLQSVPANSQYIINPNPAAAGSKTNWSFPLNPLNLFSSNTSTKKR
jgi:hypothetical protein